MEAGQVVRITLRIPDDLHKKIVEIAKREDRSLNWQMVKLMQLGAAQFVPSTTTEVNTQSD